MIKFTTEAKSPVPKNESPLPKIVQLMPEKRKKGPKSVIPSRNSRSWKVSEVKKAPGDFPGGAVVKNPPANAGATGSSPGPVNAGDTGSSPGPGRSHMLRSK